METTYSKEELQAHLELIKPTGYDLKLLENEFKKSYKTESIFLIRVGRF